MFRVLLLVLMVSCGQMQGEDGKNGADGLAGLDGAPGRDGGNYYYYETQVNIQQAMSEDVMDKAVTIEGGLSINSLNLLR